MQLWESCLKELNQLGVGEGFLFFFILFPRLHISNGWSFSILLGTWVDLKDRRSHMVKTAGKSEDDSKLLMDFMELS